MSDTVQPLDGKDELKLQSTPDQGGPSQMITIRVRTTAEVVQKTPTVLAALRTAIENWAQEYDVDVDITGP